MANKTISFSRVPSDTSGSAPVDVETSPVEAKSTDVNTPVTALSAPTNTAPVNRAFYGGDEEESSNEDTRWPRLNLVQGMSSAQLKEVAPEGQFAYKGMLHIPIPAKIVVIGFSPKRFVEKMVKFGEGKPRYASTVQEVQELGGTEFWRDSRDNREISSRKPWFQPMTTALLLIQKWEGLDPNDEDHFQAIADDGTAFAPAVFTVKSTSFGSFYVPLKTENTGGLLKSGYYVRNLRLTSRQKTAWEPVPTILDPTSEAVRNLAKKFLV